MSDTDGRIRVGVNGYGVIGKRVADRRGISLFGATEDAVRTMAAAGVEVAGGLDDLLSAVDVVVDCTPKGLGAESVTLPRGRCPVRRPGR